MAAPEASEPHTRRGPVRWRSGFVVPAVLAAVLAVVLAGVAGCATGAKVVELDDDVKLLVAPKADSGDAALLRGELTVLGGCVGIADHVVIWPHGTEVVDGRELRVKVPDLGSFSLGDEVSIGGGEAVEPPPRKQVELAGVTVPAACAAHAIWMSAPSG